MASIITEAIEGYATGRFDGQVEIKRFLQANPDFPKTRHGNVTQQKVTGILTNPLYAGYIYMERWGLRLIPASHEALVNFATFQTVQERRNGVAKAPSRKDLNEDFALRGFVTCGSCEKPLTACWSKGRNKKYPYYLCDTKGCPDYRKSIRRDVIEGEFEDLLQDLRPSANLFSIALEMFRDLWAAKEEALDQDRASSQGNWTKRTGSLGN